MKKLLLLIFGITQIILAQSQNPTQPKVTVYKPFQADETVDPTQVDKIVDMNMIKFNYDIIGRGVFALNFERAFTKKLSGEIGFGLTYRDWLYEKVGDLSFDDGWGEENVRIKPGLYFEANIHYYPKEDVFDGLYFSPIVRYRSYNLTGPSDAPIPNADWGYQFTEFGLTVGYETEIRFFNQISDYYVGFDYVLLNYYDTKTSARKTFHLL